MNPTFEDVEAHLDLLLLPSSGKPTATGPLAFPDVCSAWAAIKPMLGYLKWFPIPARWRAVLDAATNAMNTACP